ncbi:unnamed protein product [Heligmosomoides polygyrus]|uniref:Reverse transcriptase domain-containing protein n=1 Tax=Heligmosomoides polygyrus TaxID=6339 RepID=A0A183GII8_HELPZ|nr:unnamed protein product [Heligmosomoides polygyrus]
MVLERRVEAAVKKEAYKLWQETRAPEHFTAYRKVKRLVKTAVAKAKVRKVIGKMKLGKAAGPDGVPVKAWEVLADSGINWLTQFLNRKTTKEGKMPDDWRNNSIDPIFKQRVDASECSNYRGIKLTSYTIKIYERLVDSRPRKMVPISQVHWGFIPRGPPRTPSFIARQVMEKYREKRKPSYLVFLNLEKAYDRLSRAVL